EEMQTSLDAYLKSYNKNRPHQGRGMKGRIPVAGLQGRHQAIESEKGGAQGRRTERYPNSGRLILPTDAALSGEYPLRTSRHAKNHRNAALGILLKHALIPGSHPKIEHRDSFPKVSLGF